MRGQCVIKSMTQTWTFRIIFQIFFHTEISTLSLARYMKLKVEHYLLFIFIPPKLANLFEELKNTSLHLLTVLLQITLVLILAACECATFASVRINFTNRMYKHLAKVDNQKHCSLHDVFYSLFYDVCKKMHKSTDAKVAVKCWCN